MSSGPPSQARFGPFFANVWGEIKKKSCHAPIPFFWMIASELAPGGRRDARAAYRSIFERISASLGREPTSALSRVDLAINFSGGSQ